MDTYIEGISKNLRLKDEIFTYFHLKFKPRLESMFQMLKGQWSPHSSAFSPHSTQCNSYTSEKFHCTSDVHLGQADVMKGGRNIVAFMYGSQISMEIYY